MLGVGSKLGKYTPPAKKAKKEDKDSYDVYARASQSSYRLPEDRYKSVDGLRYLPNEIGKETAVFYQAETGKYIVSERGTLLEETREKKGKVRNSRTHLNNLTTAVKDLSADALLVLGLTKFSNRYKRLSSKVDILNDRYGKENIILVGHSLGGRLAEDVAREKNMTSRTFNAGASPLDLLTGRRRKGDHINYRIASDLFSRHSPNQESDVIVPYSEEKGKAHTIQQFLLKK